jgi:ATP-binding cassette subfamily F protein 3
MEGNKRRLPPTEVRHEKDPNRSTEFLIESLSLMVGGKTLLDNARLQLVHGRKYGLVGKNGIGKTQLLTALARGDIEKMATHL